MNLPPDSATMRRVGGAASLTPTESYLRRLAHLAELRLYQAGGGKGSKPKPPKDPPTHEEQRQEAAKLQARQQRYLRKYGHRLPPAATE